MHDDKFELYCIFVSMLLMILRFIHRVRISPLMKEVVHNPSVPGQLALGQVVAAMTYSLSCARIRIARRKCYFFRTIGSDSSAASLN